MIPSPEFLTFAKARGLTAPDETGEWEPLTGGISSDIWHLQSSAGDFCVKQALAKLKVQAEWTAPVERNAFEWAYLKVASRIAPGRVPKPIAHDEGAGLLAMAWLPPEAHRLWKTELLAGCVDVAVAQAVGALVGRIHRGTARDPAIAAQFRTDVTFHDLRIDAYLLATARAHADLAAALEQIAGTTAHTKLALVHGDVSPKNILVGPDGPVLVDAETAWFGDPAFDLAFCLNHLIIKARVVEGAAEALSQSFDAMSAAYFDLVDWEPRAEIESRAARLLPALALARVDGKSPLEYLSEHQRSDLRSDARAGVQAAAATLPEAKAALLRAH